MEPDAFVEKSTAIVEKNRTAFVRREAKHACVRTRGRGYGYYEQKRARESECERVRGGERRLVWWFSIPFSSRFCATLCYDIVEASSAPVICVARTYVGRYA